MLYDGTIDREWENIRMTMMMDQSCGVLFLTSFERDTRSIHVSLRISAGL